MGAKMANIAITSFLCTAVVLGGFIVTAGNSSYSHKIRKLSNAANNITEDKHLPTPPPSERSNVIYIQRDNRFTNEGGSILTPHGRLVYHPIKTLNGPIVDTSREPRNNDTGTKNHSDDILQELSKNEHYSKIHALNGKNYTQSGGKSSTPSGQLYGPNQVLTGANLDDLEKIKKIYAMRGTDNLAKNGAPSVKHNGQYAYHPDQSLKDPDFNRPPQSDVGEESDVLSKELAELERLNKIYTMNDNHLSKNGGPSKTSNREFAAHLLNDPDFNHSPQRSETEEKNGNTNKEFSDNEHYKKTDSMNEETFARDGVRPWLPQVQFNGGSTKLKLHKSSKSSHPFSNFAFHNEEGSEVKSNKLTDPERNHHIQVINKDIKKGESSSPNEQIAYRPDQLLNDTKKDSKVLSKELDELERYNKLYALISIDLGKNGGPNWIPNEQFDPHRDTFLQLDAEEGSNEISKELHYLENFNKTIATNGSHFTKNYGPVDGQFSYQPGQSLNDHDFNSLPGREPFTIGPKKPNSNCTGACPHHNPEPQHFNADSEQKDDNNIPVKLADPKRNIKMHSSEDKFGGKDVSSWMPNAPFGQPLTNNAGFKSVSVPQNDAFNSEEDDDIISKELADLERYNKMYTANGIKTINNDEPAKSPNEQFAYRPDQLLKDNFKGLPGRKPLDLGPLQGSKPRINWLPNKVCRDPKDCPPPFFDPNFHWMYPSSGRSVLHSHSS